MSTNNLGGGYYGLTITLDAPGITTGATAAELKFASAFAYAIDGIRYSKASGDFSLTAASRALSASQVCLLGVWVGTATGTVTINQGPSCDADALTAGTVVLQLPEQLTAKALAGLVKLKTSSAQTFTPGTTAPTAITTTFYDTVMMPSKPFTS